MGITFLFAISCFYIYCAAGFQIKNFEYTGTVTIDESQLNVAEVLSATSRNCAIKCFTRNCDYIAKKTGSKECVCVGVGETLPQGTWNLFIDGIFLIQ